jgi:molybdenum cofactor biosynthesis enzyme MoaA
MTDSTASVWGDRMVRRLGGLKAALELPTLAQEDVEAGITLELPLRAVLEARRAIENTLALDAASPLLLEIRPHVALAPAEIERLMPGMSAAQVEEALALLFGWAERASKRFTLDLERAWVFLTPWTTLSDLRQASDAIRRLGLAQRIGRALASRLCLTPSNPLFAGARADGLLNGGQRGPDDPVDWRFRDEIVAAAVLAFTNERRFDDATALDSLDAALDAIAGGARGKTRRRLQFAPAPAQQRRERGHQVHRVELRGEVARVDRRATASAIAAARRAASAGAREIVIGGQEPLRAWFLEDLIALCRDLGVGQVTIETRSADVDDELARRLAAAGLSSARVELGEDDATFRGIESLTEAGVDVDLLVHLDRAGPSRLLAAAQRAAAIAGRARLRAIEVRCDLGLDVPAAARAIVDAKRMVEPAGIALSMGSRAELPPCVFEQPVSLSELFHLSEVVVQQTGADYERLPACSECSASYACPGALHSLAEAVAPFVRPLGSAETQRVAAPPEEEAHYENELESRLFFTDAEGRERERRVLRVNFHCNQACAFCFVDRELTVPDAATIFARIDDAAAHDAELALSGGEPTLNPRLLDFIAHARHAGVRDLELQTNAVKMADASYAAALAASGLSRAFVSLHGVTAATCDTVTSAPGTFDRTVKGLRNMIAAGLPVRINFVMCGANHAEFAELPAFVDRELRSAGNALVEIVFSFVAPMTELVPRDARLIPRFRDVASSLDRGFHESLRLGFELHGFESQCGVPPCFLPEEVRQRHFATELPDRARAAASQGFVKAPVCAECAFERRCFGVRASYAEMYGTDELVPVRASDSSST